MKVYDWFNFTFADGSVVIARGMSKTELKREEMRRGKCTGKSYAGRW